MFKKIALAAFAVASLSAFAQNSDWAMKYDTYHIGQTDLGSASNWDLWKIVHHDLKGVNANDAYTINNFLMEAPADQSTVVIKALANNYKQASMVRDEVAMARFGTEADYAWLSYPPLTWSGTPGQNSWSNLTMTTTPSGNMTMNADVDVAMTDDQSRPMRMVMSHHGARDIDYDRAIRILDSNLNDTDRGTLSEIFHPQPFDPMTYTNASVLDAVIRVVESNAAMVDNLGRYAWYNHFDAHYYDTHKWDW